MSSDKKLNVFVSYSRKDQEWLERVQVHLTPLARGGKLDLWDDTQIRTGQRWRDEIKAALVRADVAVLLISADFYASDFIAKNELPPLLDAAQGERGLIILGVHINYSHFEDDEILSEYQTANTPDNPIKSLSEADQEKVFKDLARRVRELVPPAQSTPPPIPPEYLAWLGRHCADVTLLGQDIQQGHAFTLSHVYVSALTHRPLVALPSSAQDEEQERFREAEARRSGLLLYHIDQRSLYVAAPAGAGKSTFCRWAALQSIEGAPRSHPVPAPEGYEEPIATNLRSRLPLLVPLRDFWTTMDCGRGLREWKQTDLERALAAWIDRSPPPGLRGTLLKDHLAAGSAFLLLDGLDEVAVSETRDGNMVYPRALLLSGLTDALPNWERAGNRTLITSRPYGLDEAGVARLGLARASLAPLPEPLQELFVTRWFHALGKPEPAGHLIEAMRGRGDLAPLTENPMLLTAVCVLYDNGGRLPEDRYELYKGIVGCVLHNRYPGDAREREPVLRRLEAIAYGMHTGEPGGAPRQTPAAEISWVETERLLADFAEQNPSLGRGEVDAAVQREELLTRSGLLVPRPSERAAFYHFSFQEFLAAQRIARGSDRRVEEAFRGRGTVPEWRPTLLFLFAAQIFNKDPERGLDLLTSLLASQDRAAVKASPAASVFVAGALELCLGKGYRIPDKLTESFRQLALSAIEDEIELRDRQALGLCLGRLGDPRVLDLRNPAAYVEVRAGIYRYGVKGEMLRVAEPFRISRYPVTNGQYRAFMKDGGYRERKWWSAAGWKWLQDQQVTAPDFWHDQKFNAPNQPVVGVSFWEAEACCAWAGGRLPREREWEAAARGPEGREFPWGNGWENGICNTREAGLGATSPVGLFPRSRQARLGIEDMAGNILEWCATLYDVPDDTAFARDPNALYLLRGGSWGDLLINARSAERSGNVPSARFSAIGFRVVRSSPIDDR
jgi:hypothetical protein